MYLSMKKVHFLSQGSLRHSAMLSPHHHYWPGRGATLFCLLWNFLRGGAGNRSNLTVFGCLEETLPAATSPPSIAPISLHWTFVTMWLLSFSTLFPYLSLYAAVQQAYTTPQRWQPILSLCAFLHLSVPSIGIAAPPKNLAGCPTLDLCHCGCSQSAPCSPISPFWQRSNKPTPHHSGIQFSLSACHPAPPSCPASLPCPALHRFSTVQSVKLDLFKSSKRLVNPQVCTHLAL